MTTFSEVRPDAVYTTPEVARLFRVRPKTVREWCRLGRAKKLPQCGPVKLLGSEVLRLAGLQAAPVKVETPTERAKRAKADWDAIRSL